MKLEVFERIVNGIISQQEKSHTLYKMGIDLMGHEESYQETVSLLLRAYYGADGADWIDWYIYEREGISGNINDATDADGNPICYDIPSLWRFVRGEDVTCQGNETRVSFLSDLFERRGAKSC